MSASNGAADRTPDVDELRNEIRQTRAELGETVQALAAKADVKARAKETAEQTKQRLLESAQQAKEKVRGQASHAAQTALQATDKVRGQASQAAQSALSSAQDAGVSARRNPVPWASVAAAGVALVVVLLVVRGRRR